MLSSKKSLLQTERRYFERNRSKFLRKYKGKFLLIKDNSLIGVFDSAEEAYQTGLEKFGNNPMFIREVVKEEVKPLIMAVVG